LKSIAGLRIQREENMKISNMLLTVALTLFAGQVLADIDFLSDYSKLKKPVDGLHNLRYVAPGAFKKLNDYNQLFIDQPEIFISPDSKYQGAKPDDMKIIADSLREAMSSEFRSSFEVVDQPGLGVITVRIALVNLHLKKAKRGLLSYTPVGAVAHATKSALEENITKKISLVEVTIEAEVLDSATGEVLGATIEHRGQAKDKKAKLKEEASSWEEINSLLHTYAVRMKCRLDNARLPEGQQTACTL
jgi:hypothetical protein